MYIESINIQGYRNFLNKTIEFREGVNVIIGHNNAGKSSLLKAMGLLLNSDMSRRLDIDDFSKKTTLEELQKKPPQVNISIKIVQSEDEDLNSDDLVTVANWLTKLDEPYEAMLTYTFFLPADKHAEYTAELALCTSKDQAWLTIKHQFLRFYSYKIFGGNPVLQTAADSESLHKFDFQFLNAIRDVERDMFTGRNTLLRDVLDFFMDYEIKSADESSITSTQKRQEIKALKAQFTTNAGVLIDELQKRMKAGKEHILEYATETGATFNNAQPDFDGTISDVDMYSALKLIIGYSGPDIKIPATHNGLGYNNLIFMSILLAKMQVNSDGKYLGSNAKVFPVLAIEEPEAHLHPAMQYKFLKFLKENKEKRKVRQIFVTTHSTQITSAVLLDEIICLHNEEGEISVGYPGKTFPNTIAGQKSKAYVQRFLDATRSDMLFAQKIIFVEGLAEQVLLPTLSKYCGFSLEDYHIAVIPVGGRFFDHFLPMFDTKQPHSLPKKVICLKDRDPERKLKTGKSYFTSCHPFQFDQEPELYDYKDHVSEKITEYTTHPNIRFFGQNHIKGKTFEYELLLSNLTNDILITETISNSEELRTLLKYNREGKPVSDLFDEIHNSASKTAFQESLEAVNDKVWVEEDKRASIVAYRYLSSIAKGENALELAEILEENLILPTLPSDADPTAKFKIDFTVPQYIIDSITWICQ